MDILYWLMILSFLWWEQRLSLKLYVMEIPELLSLDAGWNILSLGTGEIQFGY